MARLSDKMYADKASLRVWAKQVRNELDIEAISKKLVEKLRNTKEYQNALNIMIFYPKGNEINLIPLLNDNEKNFYLPRIEGENLLCCPYKNGDELSKSCFNTSEPTSESISTCPDLIIVPALAVDKNNYRLGYGGGFYDRYLSDKSSKKITCIPKELIVETVYPQCFDILLDMIISI